MNLGEALTELEQMTSEQSGVTLPQRRAVRVLLDYLERDADLSAERAKAMDAGRLALDAGRATIESLRVELEERHAMVRKLSEQLAMTEDGRGVALAEINRLGTELYELHESFNRTSSALVEMRHERDELLAEREPLQLKVGELTSDLAMARKMLSELEAPAS